MIDIFCSSAWRVAVIHDGYYISGMNGAIYAGDSWTQNVQRQQSGGWHYYSYDNVLNDIRFWVDIKDQPSSCWK
jgi:hypothetical protein